MTELGRVFGVLRETSCPSARSNPWSHISSSQWPSVFKLMDIGAMIHPVSTNVREDDVELWWPSLGATIRDAAAIRRLIDNPVVTPEAVPDKCFGRESLANARITLRDHGCITIDFLFSADQQLELCRAISSLSLDTGDESLSHNVCRNCARGDSARIFEIVDNALTTERFRYILDDGIGLNYQLSHMAQSLPEQGMCWHRDVDWPLEENVVTLIHALESDVEERGGAFLHYREHCNEMRFLYRKEGWTTLLINAHPRGSRPFHAVSRYVSGCRRRATMIIQCPLVPADFSRKER